MLLPTVLTWVPGVPCWPGGPGSPWGPWETQRQSKIRWWCTKIHMQVKGVRGHIEIIFSFSNVIKYVMSRDYLLTGNELTVTWCGSCCTYQISLGTVGPIISSHTLRTGENNIEIESDSQKHEEKLLYQLQLNSSNILSLATTNLWRWRLIKHWLIWCNDWKTTACSC